jgi:phosphoserine phosphatase
MPLTISKSLLLRKLRIIDSEKFKYKIILEIYRHPKFERINQKFIKSLIPYINTKIIKKYADNDSNNKLILILSASPDMYISDVANAMDYTGKGSYAVNNQFIHLFGPGKINFLNKYYPKEKYRYVYSISDSKSDLELLKLFESYDIIEP